MHAQFITRRPSLPLGYKAGDLPPVQRPLHSDESIEAYLLDRSANSDLVLVRPPEREIESIREWWRILGPNVATELAGGVRADGAIAVRLCCEWWPDKQIESIAESQWKPLLIATLKILRMAHEGNFHPYLKPSLIWFSQETSRFIPLCAVRAADVLQQDILRDFAVALISRSTGIDFAAVTTGSHSLKSWCSGSA
jgi:hypothetical protein